ADYLLNEKRGELVELEQRQEVTIVVKGRGDFVDGQIELETSTQSKDSPADENALIPLTASPQEITATPD
ncbi:MAG: hypothetical protein GWN87_33770, partial [Desulfuromonadales bacterium]|nr:hypothetical protein [Desulfuromonadales bacterium]NIS44411.1 hypothetical protein [Desulfuromonadales bacterium]